MKDRGLRLIVSNAHAGVQAARKRHFQGVGWQRCQVRFKRELGRKVSHQYLSEMGGATMLRCDFRWTSGGVAFMYSPSQFAKPLDAAGITP